MARVRLAGVDLPASKKILWALTYIYGIGLTTSKKILEATGIDPDKRTDDLTESDINRLREEIERKYMVEGDLRRQVGLSIKRLQEISCYRGIRHRRRLPLRGQRSKTNAKTARGKHSPQMKKK
ncbi:MAG: 30S ribosomal protein S13 [Cyanobacteria bacterium HKST-UBA06]|nr:30S ribosomal protein S13 [Cyanobacteria bacterium HKST-UBA05]MCA9798106.1 30S ribosomal protein S13 [Cyanobacteria bacterium HKST-UBA04]MCA9807416.1 30S ribosomal protein S13 [Cyanobacteria bacterium HKST-UBA06]MCA9841796.1 30S ribosomal protein S13 [Cyanobacteria bacterium HKST-UBA03]